jgi:hypothetical protein
MRGETMSDIRLVEYRALRETIARRGTVRMWVILTGILAWCALAVAVWATGAQGSLTLVPMLALAATFEISFFIHRAIERVGRYLQVYFEEDGQGWEHTAMAYGRKFPGGADPLFVTLFSVATIVNFLALPGSATRRPGWILLSFVAHLILGWRFFSARRLAAGQRALDLERFAGLKKDAAGGAMTSN